MRTVAIIGASTNRDKFGNKAVRAYLSKNFTVFPVNPQEALIEGLQTFKSISEVPVRPDRVSVYVRPEVLKRILPEIASKGCDELFLNPGTFSEALLSEAKILGRKIIRGCSIIAIGVNPSQL